MNCAQLQTKAAIRTADMRRGNTLSVTADSDDYPHLVRRIEVQVQALVMQHVD